MARPNGLTWAIAASVAAHAVAGGLVLALPHGHRGEGEVRVVRVQLLAPPTTAVPAAAVTPPRPPPRPVVVPPPPKPKPKATVTPRPRPKPRPVVQPVVHPPPEAASPATPPAVARAAENAPAAAPTATPAAPISLPDPQVAHPGGAPANGVAGGPGPGRATAIAALNRRLEHHRRYPLQARRRGIEGRVGLRFSVAPDGRLIGAHVARTSGSSLLDRAALRTLDDCFPLDPPTARMLAGEPITVDLTFRLVED